MGIQLKPRQALNKAFLKVKPTREEIERFKSHLKKVLDRSNDTESEEFHKNLISDFLKNTWYAPEHFINTKGRSDLVIHNGKNSRSSVGVVLEVKKPTNRHEMMRADALNSKAMQELLLYYFHERKLEKNLELRHLVVTNIYEWFIFDAQLFEKLFARNKKLVKQFTDFEEGRLSGKTTDFFYREIASPAIEAVTEELEYTHFRLEDYKKPLLNDDPADDRKLIALFKLLSPEHLLKKPFANDSNSLNKDFYLELLHLIGLKQTGKSKKLIERHPAGERDSGSLLENALEQLQLNNRLRKVEKPSSFGKTQEEQYYNLALELVITWINRILFLKLLEAQLLNYHREDERYAFLQPERIRNFDDLHSLFFAVLAHRPEDRPDFLRGEYERVPYLNSSLFEPTPLEDDALYINQLRDDREIHYHPKTVLKTYDGQRRTGKVSSLRYLFDFLNHYDFSSEGGEDIQEDNKTLINASVLGLIFEKINGYKDGSFFTPGFITMYMCRETIRRAVLQKFKEKKGWDCADTDELYDHIDDREEANRIVNGLKICDPAVGSGHFLVSALNEIIALKNDLRILQDRQGRRLKEYQFEVVNDELVVTDEEGALFEYRPGSRESQRVQEALFHEKQTLIENCLFGVDINPNSVKICRLRLWIELLKNAYYKEDGYLETLPNIDINIKCGNSLISRFDLDADLAPALKKSKYSIDSYRVAVGTYHNATDPEEKTRLLRLIEEIKESFRSEIRLTDPLVKKASKLRGDIFNLANRSLLFEESGEDVEKRRKKEGKLAARLEKVEREIEEIQNNQIYENAFEWRFEFPEVLNESGDFVGFDVVIGNPPYFSMSKIREQADYFSKANFETYSKGSDIYCLFYEMGGRILKPKGFLTYITSNSWLRAIYGNLLKNYFIKNLQPILLLNIEDLQIFEEATVESNIITLQKRQLTNSFPVVNLSNDYKLGSSLSAYFEENHFEFKIPETAEWFIGNQKVGDLKQKIEANGKLLKEFKIDINRGFLTGYNKAFIIDEQKKEELIRLDERNAEIIKPILRGRDVQKYSYKFEKVYLINSHNGLKSKNIKRIELKKDFPFLFDHLKSFLPKVKSRYDKGDHWSNLRNCAYLEDFEKPKIVWGEISDKPKFAYDDSGFFAEATTFLMTGEKLKFLLAILNSKVSEWYFNLIGTTTGMGTNRWKKYKIELLPIIDPSESQEQAIVDLVNQILNSKKQDPSADTSALEAEIDRLVYGLYGLTEEEVGVIEGME